MSTTQQLRTEIISVIDRLPLDGLKLLAEFVEFLQSKFRLISLVSQPAIDTAPQMDTLAVNHSELWHKIETLEQQHPNLSSQNKQALALLKEATEQPDDKGDAWWDDFEAELRQNRLTFPERDIL